MVSRKKTSRARNRKSARKNIARVTQIKSNTKIKPRWSGQKLYKKLCALKEIKPGRNGGAKEARLARAQ
jgi:hypothetical protein